jgi:hypothetical protein
MTSVLKAETGDSRRAYRAPNGSTDWDPGYWKLECGLNEYVAGTSNNAPQCQGNVAGISVNPSTGRPHALLCCHP